MLQRHFKEAEIYLLRFQQCMTRAMTLIKMYFVGSLRALTADVSKRLSEKVCIYLLCLLLAKSEPLPGRTSLPQLKHTCCIPDFKPCQDPSRPSSPLRVHDLAHLFSARGPFQPLAYACGPFS